MKRRLLLIGCVAASSTFVLAGPVSGSMFGYTDLGTGSQQLILNGGTITLNASDSGWWDNTGANNPAITNYIVGFCSTGCTPYGPYENDFFVFSLDGVNDVTITSATLSIWNPSNGYDSTLPSEIYEVGSVSTSIAMLEAGGSGDTAIYNALASGTLWGSVTVNAATDGTQVMITLNAAAISAINANEGGQLAFGGTLVDPTTGVPEPTGLLLSGTMLAGLAFVRMRGRSIIHRFPEVRRQ